MTKQQHRHEALAKRDRLTIDFRRQAAEKLANKVNSLLSLIDASIVAGFWPIGSEIDPRPLLLALQEQGKTICLPAITDSKARKMQFRQFNLEDELIPMGFGTMGPPARAAILDPDLILLPLAAFDAIGNRIGYGGGFYDRIVADMRSRQKQPFLVGLAFDCQEVNSIVAEDHDISMQAILTESGLRLF
ncbi:5-formyltetrahydrofolate cyclo-ligase [Bartonella sp. HY329]|uniref:5-formyltetrahydrofolate cyclo-ligase n=1 Tax=unclassified Bartonella TaxID=2645622 RepID=UPI0021C7B600|nr:MULTISPECIES: 5-formyltetrahydrofolate cyclo-ligase [unclassified Bartonella]UXM95301.1 5-formyltetrahydrofolate cyclo-ligase [Bartonella sp. HY329]UXN09626.1 5-formyltetrahydrofolate cyclo-ligase [Bartonella sp. HY328]